MGVCVRQEAYAKSSAGSEREEQAAELRRTAAAKDGLARELAAEQVVGRAKDHEVARLKAKVKRNYKLNLGILS